MAIGILNAGLSGLNAAQSGLSTAGHNIANAGTPGFNRQQVVQSPLTALATGSGFIGEGTQVATIRRLYNGFLDRQVLSAQSDSSRLSAYYTEIQQVDNMLADPNAGVSPVLQDFFSALQSLANNPADSTTRQSLLNAGNALTARFQSVDQRLQQLYDGVTTQLKEKVADINSYAKQIAQLNQKIVVAQSGANNQPANDLLDQRDVLIANLNKEMQVTVIAQDDGTTNVLVANGQPLVMGSTAFSLSAVSSPVDPGKTVIGYSNLGGSMVLPESSFSGGAVAGLLAFRSETLEPARNMLGRIAIVLADSFNRQHQMGMDTNGILGGDFFRVGSPTVIADAKNTGTGNFAVALSDSSALTASDYRLSYNGTAYTLIRLSDGNQTSFSSFPQTVDGLTLSLSSGAAAAGDEFLLRPTVGGAGSISVAINNVKELAVAAPIRTGVGTGNTGSGKISAGAVNGLPLDANLLQPVTITFTGANSFDVSGTGTGNPTGLAYTAGGNITFNGWTLQISGVPKAGDSFTIVPNTTGAADNRNALLLAGLQTGALVGGAMNYQSAYGVLVGTVGNKAHELQATSTAQAALVDQATAARETYSGVNLDEEAANLMRYQQAYQASAKIMALAAKLFDSILQLG